MQTETTTYDRQRPLEDWHRPPASGELAALNEILDDGRLSGGAPVIAAYEQALASWLGVPYVVAVNSGSSALYATLHVLGAGEGTEVLLPAAAPLPSALPILALGASPVLVDNLAGRLALDPDDLAAKVTSRTVAALSVPLWGYPADVDHLAPFLDHVGLPLVEDAAQAHGTVVSGRPAGTLGTAGCFSTHDRKLVATGEGGFVATADPKVHNAVDCFTRLGHLDGSHIGMNLKLAAPLAAIGCRRLRGLDDQLRIREKNARTVLAVLDEDDPVRELGYSDGGRPNYYSLVLRAGAKDAHELVETLTTWGLPPDSRRWNYQPLHSRRMFTRWSTPCPNAEKLATRTLQLPIHPGLDRPQLAYVARCLRAALDHVRTAA